MNFLFPAAFFLGSLAVPIVVLYLRRPSRRPLEFSSLLFWQRVLEREPHRKFLGRLRNPLSLILQLVILLLLLLALARPQETSSRGPRSTVLVLDMRARMQGPGIFSEALLAADKLRPFFLFGAVPTRIIEADELRAVDPTFASLRNLNTPEEYEAARCAVV